MPRTTPFEVAPHQSRNQRGHRDGRRVSIAGAAGEAHLTIPRMMPMILALRGASCAGYQLGASCRRRRGQRGGGGARASNSLAVDKLVRSIVQDGRRWRIGKQACGSELQRRRFA